MMWLAEACGIWGLAGSCVWSFARTRRGMLAVQILTTPGFAAHWLLRGDMVAALATMLSLALALAATALEGSHRRAAQAVFLALLLPVTVLSLRSWQGLPSGFAACGTALVCLGRWQTDPGRFRLLMLASGLPWLGHDLLAASAPGVGADLFGLGRAAFLALRAAGPGSVLAAPAATR